MSVTEVPSHQQAPPERAPDHGGGFAAAAGRPSDRQRTLQLWLAAVWLFDAVLQLQPFMFTRGTNGFSGMIGATAAGNPGWISDSITWNASIVGHEPVLTNSLFALVQFVIAFGIIWRRTLKPALVLSIVWSLGVWWFGEGLGAVFSGGATPLGGGPGAVLFYAVLAVVLWPRQHPDAPFVAARAVGIRAARGIWVLVWAGLTVLCVVGSGRSPRALQAIVSSMASGEPGWLARADRFSASLLGHDGTALAVTLAALCCLAALSVYLAPTYARLVIALVVVAFVLIWVTVQNFGGILAGGATDPNSAPLVVLFALAYWPRPDVRATWRSRAGACAAAEVEGRGAGVGEPGWGEVHAPWA